MMSHEEDISVIRESKVWSIGSQKEDELVYMVKGRTILSSELFLLGSELFYRVI